MSQAMYQVYLGIDKDKISVREFKNELKNLEEKGIYFHWLFDEQTTGVGLFEMNNVKKKLKGSYVFDGEYYSLLD